MGEGTKRIKLSLTIKMRLHTRLDRDTYLLMSHATGQVNEACEFLIRANIDALNLSVATRGPT